MIHLSALFSANRRGISLTYGLTALENLFDLLYPFAIGLAINGLIVSEWWWTTPLVLIWLAHTGCGYWRQRFDTRLFTGIYTDIATRTVLEQRGQGDSTSAIAARTDMVEELVEFLEHDVPAAILAVSGLLGGAAMLAYYDHIAGLIMGAILLPVLVVYWRYARQARAMEGRFNNLSETEVDVIQKLPRPAVHRHFRHLSRWRVRISDAEARSWAVLELLALLLFVAVLVRLTGVESLMAGDVFAAVAYGLRMLDAMDQLPDSVTAISRMRDNLTRLD